MYDDKSEETILGYRRSLTLICWSWHIEHVTTATYSEDGVPKFAKFYPQTFIIRY